MDSKQMYLDFARKIKDKRLELGITLGYSMTDYFFELVIKSLQAKGLNVASTENLSTSFITNSPTEDFLIKFKVINNHIEKIFDEYKKMGLLLQDTWITTNNRKDLEIIIIEFSFAEDYYRVHLDTGSCNLLYNELKRDL